MQVCGNDEQNLETCKEEYMNGRVSKYIVSSKFRVSTIHHEEQESIKSVTYTEQNTKPSNPTAGP